MATSVKHAVQREGMTTLETVLVLVVLFLLLAILWCLWPRVVPQKVRSFSNIGCPANAAPSNATQLNACLAGLEFDTVAAAGDEQRLLVRDTMPGPACQFGDTTQTCRHGPLAKIEPVIGGHQRDTTELNEGRIIARLFLRSGESESYPKLGLVPTDTTYWWIQRQSATTAISRYIRVSGGGDGVVATQEDTITIELHPPGTFQQALARFIWDDADEKTQGACGAGCCRP